MAKDNSRTFAGLRFNGDSGDFQRWKDAVLAHLISLSNRRCRDKGEQIIASHRLGGSAEQDCSLVSTLRGGRANEVRLVGIQPTSTGTLDKWHRALVGVQDAIPRAERPCPIDATEADAIASALKAFDIDKSQTMACPLGPDAEHKMRYRLLICSSQACSAASSIKCPWRGKLVTCLEPECASVFEYGEHRTTATSPKRNKLTTPQKTFCRDLAENYARPMRIRHALPRKFSTPLEDLPSLKTVQIFVNHSGRTQMENHDCVDGRRTWVHDHAYNGFESMTEAFYFGWQLDETDKPFVGNGSDVRPFIVGLSTKALMLIMTLPPESYVLHLDTTYKMNQRGYPEQVVGISDRSRKFHLVAIFIVSQKAHPVFQSALMALLRLYYWIPQRDLVVQYVMTDSDTAQCNALEAVFGETPSIAS